jgi:hypothetical protein
MDVDLEGTTEDVDLVPEPALAQGGNNNGNGWKKA